MDQPLLGAAFALSAAFVWAFAVILFKRCGEKVPPLALNLFKNVTALVLLSLTLLVLGEGFGALEGYPASDLWILFLSGFLGITVADTLFFYSLNLVGVSIVSIVDTLYSPFIILFSWMLLAEEMTALQYLGAALIVTAVVITTRVEPPKDRTRKQLLAGILIGVVDMALMGLGIVIAKRVLEGFPMIWATTLRLAAGTAALVVIAMLLPQRKTLFSAFRPSRNWLFMVPASVLGAYLACIFWIGGFKYTSASIAAILNQTSTVFAIILAVLILKEKMTKRKFLAVALAMSGIVLVLAQEG